MDESFLKELPQELNAFLKGSKDDDKRSIYERLSNLGKNEKLLKEIYTSITTKCC